MNSSMSCGLSWEWIVPWVVAWMIAWAGMSNSMSWEISDGMCWSLCDGMSWGRTNIMNWEWAEGWVGPVWYHGLESVWCYEWCCNLGYMWKSIWYHKSKYEWGVWMRVWVRINISLYPSILSYFLAPYCAWLLSFILL